MRSMQPTQVAPSQASVAAFSNELAIEAAVIIKSADGHPMQVLRIPPMTSTHTVLGGGGYGLEIAIGNRWCDMDHGFLDGKSFRIVGGLNLPVASGVKAIIKRHTADPAKINVAFERLVVRAQDLQQEVRKMGEGRDTTVAPVASSSTSLTVDLRGGRSWVEDKTDLAVSAFEGDLKRRAGMTVWLKDAMVYGPLPILLLVFCAWILMARTKRPDRSDVGVPPANIGVAVPNQPGEEGDANPWWYGTSAPDEKWCTDIHRKRLLRMCTGDADKVRRLMDLERQRSPGITDEDAAKRAIERWERDMCS